MNLIKDTQNIWVIILFLIVLIIINTMIYCWCECCRDNNKKKHNEYDRLLIKDYGYI
jgi:heme/copper-type cytochrome/quinol oxidase subunit 2